MNSNTTLLIVAVIPVIALLIYIYKKDPHKESFGNLLKMFLLGVATIIPAGLLECIVLIFTGEDKVKTYVGLFLYVFLGVALIEEFFKWLVIKLFIYNTEKFDEYYDSIVYCTFVSLGFACLENIGYVLDNGLANGIARAITSVPGHACFGVIMGYYLCYAKFHHIRNNKKYTKYLIISLLAPVLAHTLYDHFLFASQIIAWIIFYIALVIWCVYLVKKVATQNQPFYQTNNVDNNNSHNYCPNCGNPSQGNNYCSKCGHKI